MIEMNHEDVAKRLEFIREDGEVGNAITLTPLGLNTLTDAADDEHRIVNGELVEVVHGSWKILDKDHSHCTNCGTKRNIKTQYGWEYCPSCGALMDEARTGNSLNGKDGTK